MPHHEYHFNANDGTTLFQQSWLPKGDPRAELILVHGFCEHSGRYARTAETLCRQGFAVHAMDLRGHGRSEGPRCYVRRFDNYLSDLDALLRQLDSGKRQPRFLFGHSLGGQISLRWCLARQPDLRGLVLSAPALQIRNELFPLLRHLAGAVSRVAPRLRLVRMGFRNISRDPAVHADVMADPLVFHGRFPVRTAAEILRATETTPHDYAALRLPLLILQGTGDRVVTVEGARDLCRRAGSGDRTLNLYEGLYHEVLNEPEREQVLADLLGWLEKRA